MPMRWLLLLIVVAGGMRVQAAAPAVKPFLIHLNGIGGERGCDEALIAGLRDGGFDAEVVMYDWTHGDDGLVALRNYDRNREEAKKLSKMLAARHAASPNQRIYISCHSGGVGLAVWALEDLPEGMQVEAIVMFAPALSPQYDLSRALRHVRTRAYVFTSVYDQVVLGMGTRMMGTIDRQYCEAAGLNGFVRPQGAEDQQYQKLITFPYRREWMQRYGNAGTHISALRQRFASGYVAPLLLTGRPPVTAIGPTSRPARGPDLRAATVAPPREKVQ